MKPESDRARIKKLFLSALERPQADRSTFLRESANGDASVIAGVEALLEVHGEADEFLTERGGNAEKPKGEQPGDTIGRYRLLQEIGEGGFGSVWMAEQTEPVRRKVALKIIKLGMDTKQVITRFEAERQALAMMDHTNVAKVFDGGATDAGRPYFVMELIKGVPITEYCDTNRLSTTDRLSLFTQVCQAVQHAHSKGVIHRDLKPSNVMVTLHDGVAVPKVIDFGVAKATSSELTPHTMFTEYRQIIGTPLYMSPEQAEMSGLDIDTRTDVYSLGVLLYELLTGTTPFTMQDLIEAGLGEIQRFLREKEPSRPSTRVSTLDRNGLTTLANHRSVDPRSLGKELRGDLDWIVMRTLEKDRTRRYPTAEALAADVKRHLAHEPVEASPPNALYRLGKLVRRNRGFFAAAITLLLVLVAGAITTGVAWLSAEKARREEARQRALAEQRFEATRSFAGDMLEGMQERIRDLPGASEARAYLVETSLDYLDALSNEAGGDDNLQYEVAKAYLDLGDALGDPFAANSLGDFEGAVQTYELALDLVEPALERFPREKRWRELMSVSLDGLGTAVMCLNRLAEATGYFERLRELCLKWTEENSEDLDYVECFHMAGFRMGHIHMRRGQYAQALSLYEAPEKDPRAGLFDESTASVRELHNMKVQHGLIADALMELGRFEEALVRYRETLRLTDLANDRFPNHARLMRDVGGARTHLANLLLKMGKIDESIEELDFALNYLQNIEALDASNFMVNTYIGRVLMTRGQAHAARAEALSHGSDDRAESIEAALRDFRDCQKRVQASSASSREVLSEELAREIARAEALGRETGE